MNGVVNNLKSEGATPEDRHDMTFRAKAESLPVFCVGVGPCRIVTPREIITVCRHRGGKSTPRAKARRSLLASIVRSSNGRPRPPINNARASAARISVIEGNNRQR